MLEGSREQTGCFVAVLMLASAAYSLRSVMRATHLPAEEGQAEASVRALPFVALLALAFLVFAIFALKLAKWALIAFEVTSVIAAALAFHAGVPLVVPLLIGAVTVGAVLLLRWDVL